jgi:hypothetical protein
MKYVRLEPSSIEWSGELQVNRRTIPLVKNSGPGARSLQGCEHGGHVEGLRDLLIDAGLDKGVSSRRVVLFHP